MTNYAAAPIQPIINGIISFAAGPFPPVGTPVFIGRGVSSIVRTPVGAPFFGAPAGDFLLMLDQGLPGDVGLDPAFAKSMLTQRGTLGALPGGTTITQQAVTYPNTATVRVVTSIASVGTDPNALELVVWRTN